MTAFHLRHAETDLQRKETNQGLKWTKRKGWKKKKHGMMQRCWKMRHAFVLHVQIDFAVMEYDPSNDLWIILTNSSCLPCDSLLFYPLLLSTPAPPPFLLVKLLQLLQLSRLAALGSHSAFTCGRLRSCSLNLQLSPSSPSAVSPPPSPTCLFFLAQ